MSRPSQLRLHGVALVLSVVCSSGAISTMAEAQATFPDNAIQGPRWRHIGPFRAGRTKSAVGVPTQPNVFYMAATNGGVWKTNDAGRTWRPIFDAQATGSIGAVEVAPSNSDVLYVGSGEGLQRPDLSTGDGMYRSNDAGRTWTHLGLRDAQQIPRIAIDPTNPERLFVAVLGHPYGPNAERGIYRSVNGGRSFEKVLYKDENTGGADVVLSPDNPNVVYAVLWEARQGPWENAAWSGPNSGLFKSTDGGATWTQLAGGLPTTADGLGRIGIGISPSNPRRIYVTATAGAKSGLYRSDDAGATWTRTTADNRIIGRGDDFAAVTVDPRDPNVVFSMNVVAWKSIDAGVTWQSFRGAPGGDDYQRLWINPLQPDVMLLVSDQGAVITVNGGETFSSWYNQGTAQFYHVTTDNAWPYRVCGGQQESGSACVASRGNDGSITYRDWRPVGASEYAYVAPDPLNPDIVYGGTVTRFDRRTGQTQNVSPNAGRGRGGAAGPAGGPDYFRGVRTMPVLFSPINKRKLYYGTNVVWSTVNGGNTWKRLSDDLSRATWTVPPSVGKYIGTPGAQPTRRGVVYTIAPSYVDSNTVWAGTDDGLIHVTRNGGKTWSDVTPPQIGPWWKVSIMDASHANANTAYAAVNTLRLDDLRPHIYRTRDGGKTWAEIVTGIASDQPINVVREDPVRRGLLFAGSETQVWFSLDDGDHWHSLRANMPAISIRDLVIKDDDIAVGTHGRGFWILDNITALRQWRDVSASATLFKPAVATRVRYSMYTDTPVPPDEPRALNPPDGAMIDYYLSRDAQRVTIEILNAQGRVLRTYASTDPTPAATDAGNAPYYWFRPATAPSVKTGLQRFTWDLHYARPTDQCSLPISATLYNTKCEPEGPWVLPGTYTARLTVDGDVQTQVFTVRMDPRVTTPVATLRQQHDLSVALYDAMLEAQRLAGEARTANRAEFAGNEGFGGVTAAHQSVISVLQSSDAPPTAVVIATARERLAAYAALKKRWGAR